MKPPSDTPQVEQPLQSSVDMPPRENSVQAESSKLRESSSNRRKRNEITRSTPNLQKNYYLAMKPIEKQCVLEGKQLFMIRKNEKKNQRDEQILEERKKVDLDKKFDNDWQTIER